MAASKLKGPLVHNSKPVFLVDPVDIDIRPLSATQKAKTRASHTDVAKCDRELYWLLLDKFAFRARDTSTLRQMMSTLTEYLRDFDLSQYTRGEIYRIKMDAVRLATIPPAEEQQTRVVLRDSEHDFERFAHFCREGALGRNKWYSLTTKSLPKSVK